MDTTNPLLARQGQRLLQLGIGLFFFSSFVGFAIPTLASPRVGLSVHTLGALQGVMSLALGLLWSRLSLRPLQSQIAFFCFVYSVVAILGAYAVAALTGTGIETIALAGELPHGLTRGSELQEAAIKVFAYSSAPTGLASFAFILWGLRIGRIARPPR